MQYLRVSNANHLDPQVCNAFTGKYLTVQCYKYTNRVWYLQFTVHGEYLCSALKGESESVWKSPNVMFETFVIYCFYWSVFFVLLYSFDSFFFSKYLLFVALLFHPLACKGLIVPHGLVICTDKGPSVECGFGSKKATQHKKQNIKSTAEKNHRFEATVAWPVHLFHRPTTTHTSPVQPMHITTPENEKH